MAEEKSAADKLLEKIQQQAIITGIKNFLEKNPNMKILPIVILEFIDYLDAQADSYLGDADKIIVIGRKNGHKRILILNGKENFTITTGLNVTYDKPETMLENKSSKFFIDKLTSTGIFDIITEEDKLKFAEMKDENGNISFDKLSDILGELKNIKMPEQKQISSPE